MPDLGLQHPLELMNLEFVDVCLGNESGKLALFKSLRPAII